MQQGQFQFEGGMVAADLAALAQGLVGPVENAGAGVVAAELEPDPRLVLAPEVGAGQEGAAHLDGPVQLPAHAVEVAQGRAGFHGAVVVLHGARQIVDGGQGVLGRIGRHGEEEVRVVVAQSQQGLEPLHGVS
ncbi:hypothetical protein DSECCO2_331490 [anaerobic digester metagenome]